MSGTPPPHQQTPKKCTPLTLLSLPCPSNISVPKKKKCLWKRILHPFLISKWIERDLSDYTTVGKEANLGGNLNILDNKITIDWLSVGRNRPRKASKDQASSQRHINNDLLHCWLLLITYSNQVTPTNPSNPSNNV